MPEFGISRGRLLPDHHIYTEAQVSREIRQSICDSFVLVHGGMAQNVGPVLEMVTEKYLLRCEAEWAARQEAIGLLRSIDTALCRGDIRQLAELTSRNFFGPLQTIIPWASNHYTETLIRRARDHFAADYWGFLMLGGISGGGMGFIVAPRARPRPRTFCRTSCRRRSESCSMRCPLRWSRSSMISPSTITARWLPYGKAAMR